ncbi:MAG: hypothetical protein HZB26_20505 [Candidatus Hydrogenedentes bacterium]|nr:hypothetical protein [Candidatus Hydrogenedentota bacterium]
MVGTSWLDPGSNTVYTFKDGATLEVKLSAAPQPVQGPYSVENGVISGATGMQSFDGTWDGKSVTMRGKALTKQ